MVVAYPPYAKVFFCGVLLFFLRKVETCSRFPGLPVGRSPPLLRLHHVGHPDDHREEATRRRRLHRPLRRPLHRLHPGLQEGHHHPHSEGNQLVILLAGINIFILVLNLGDLGGGLVVSADS